MDEFSRLKVIELLLSKEYEYNLEDYLTKVTDLLKEIIKDKKSIEECYLQLLQLSKERRNE